MAHVPSRSCVACRRTAAKHELIRRPDGSVVLDPSNREQGRGAYVCRTAECIARAPAALGRTLRARVDRENMREQLAGVAQGL